MSRASEWIPHQVIHIDSSAPVCQSLGPLTNNFSVPLRGGPILPQQGKRYMAAITQAVIPLTYYGVNTTNNTVQVTENPGSSPQTFLVTLLPGQYDPATFTTMVNNQFNIASAASGYGLTYTGIVDTSSGRFTFSTSSTGYTITIGYAPPTTAILPLGLPPSPSITWSNTFTSSSTLLSYGVINIQGPLEIHLRISQFPTNIFDSRTQNKSTIMACIPITGDPSTFQTTNYIPSYPKIFGDVASRVDYLDVFVTDQAGNFVYLNGQPIVFELQVFEVPW